MQSAAFPRRIKISVICGVFGSTTFYPPYLSN